MTLTTVQPTTVQPTTVQPIPPQADPDIRSNEQKPRRPRLISQWHTVDGKLVCRWITVESC